MDNEKFVEIRKKINEELKITDSNVMSKSLGISKLYYRYLQHYIIAFRKHRKLLLEKDRCYGRLFKYFRYESQYKLDKKSEIDPLINDNNEYYVLCDKCIDSEFKLKFFEKVLSDIDKMSFNIKNYIEIKKFMEGA